MEFQGGGEGGITYIKSIKEVPAKTPGTSCIKLNVGRKCYIYINENKKLLVSIKHEELR